MVVCRPDEVKNSPKSTTNQYRGGYTSRPSNSVRERQNHTSSSRNSADPSTAAGGIHEEWETASESSDVLKDSGSQHQSHLARGGRHSSSRQESKRGYSNQRHTQSRRGRYRDRPAADVSVTDDHGTGSGSNAGVDTQPSQTNTASIAAVDSSVGQSSFTTSDPSGPNGNIRPVYRVDCIVYDDPDAIRTAISKAFLRCVI